MEDNKMYKGFAPVIDENVKVLILGSFPGPRSLEIKQYYGNKGNDFWRIIGKIIGKDMHNASYANKKSSLLENKIGLWDVFAEAQRDGASDNKFTHEIYNDFNLLFQKYNNIKLVLITGNKAYDSYMKLGITTVPVYKIPSPSGANRRIGVDDKVKMILEIFNNNHIKL